ncbi:MAG: bvgS 1 [Gammaproteobacteria bacterium]|nr:bvgS 1 [Gammaproteobacteria bacterium]
MTEIEVHAPPTLERASVMLARCDASHRYKFVNSPYAQRFGLNPADVVGRESADLLGEKVFAQFKPHAEAALRGQRVDLDADLDCRRLGVQHIQCSFDPEIDTAGQVVGYVAAIFDITDRQRAEQELREADRRKDEFLAILAHELRNPLAPLQTGLEIIRQVATAGPTLIRTMNMMERQMRQLVRLVDDLRDVSGITRGKLPLQRRPVVLTKAVEQALEASRPILEAHGHDPIVHCRDDGLTVDGDPVRLAQILTNLLSNCAKFTEPGGTISLTLERDGDDAVISVSDTGIGIPPDYLEDVFEMFSQVRVHQARSRGGLGIGLALVRRLVKMHGGSVSAHSLGIGTGSTFTLRLPAIASPESVTSASAAAEPATAIKGGKARRILVVDDNDDAAALLAVLLQLEGHEVQTAADGGEAVDRAESFRPEVVLMDLEMPGIDGLEASRRIRARPWGSTILIAALTGWGQDADRRRAQEAGVDLHFVKPVDTTALLSAVARSLNGDQLVDRRS